jgi:hypothetical protein
MAGAQRGNMKLLQQSPGLAAALNFPNAVGGMRQPHANPLKKFRVCKPQPLERIRYQENGPFRGFQLGLVRSCLCRIGIAQPLVRTTLTDLQSAPGDLFALRVTVS